VRAAGSIVRARKEAVPPDVATFVRFLREGGPGPHAYAVLLGISELDPARIVAAVERGLPYRALERFQRNAGLSAAQVTGVMRMAPRTLTRRRAEGRFHPDESDRLLRVGRVFGGALALFDGDAAAARGWLLSPQPALGGAVPLSLAESEVGAREVEAAIGRIEHGVFA
jgi:putative toxin-antitoxin system antitoxin component (TIGR02293 family)